MIPVAGDPLNRASEKRTDPNGIESKRRDPSSLSLWRPEPFLLGPEKSGPPIDLTCAARNCGFARGNRSLVS